MSDNSETDEARASRQRIDAGEELLEDLIQLRKGERSYVDLAAESGGSPGKSRWADLGSGRGLKLGLPPEDVRGIALALQVSVERVWMALGRTLGHNFYREQDPALIRDMPEGSSVLADEDVFHLHSLVATLIDLRSKAPKVRHLRAARKTTGTEQYGPRGGARRNPPK